MANDSKFMVSGFENDEDDIEDEQIEDSKITDILSAAEHGKLDIVERILADKPHLVNATDKEGYTPLHRACYGKHPEVVKYLLQHGADMKANTDLFWQPLHSACRWNSKECAKILISEGADVNAPSEGGQTPLHIAASHGACYDIVQILLMHPSIDTAYKNNSKEVAADIARRSSKYANIFDMADPLINKIDVV